MRRPNILAMGRLVPDVHGGSRADVALGHAVRSLAEFAIAVDAFEEDAVALARAATRKDVIVANAPTSHATVETDAGLEERTYIHLPDNLMDQVRYWEGRQALHAKAAVLALDQLRRALMEFEGVSGLPAAQQAVCAFDLAFPALLQLRNSVAHADERVKGGRPRANRPPGPIRFTDLLGNIGYCDGAEFVMRQNKPAAPPARLSISGASYQTGVTMLQELVDQTPWRIPLSQPEPLMLPFAG